ncbi:MAG: hypothetical protein HC905_15230 [Bacteroidales bacterium]|nr:hypothetical protein [Bacteroidales bacterium]
MKLPHSLFNNGLPNIWKATAISILFIFLTIIFTLYTKKNAEKEAYHNLQEACVEIKTKISARLDAYALVLRCGAALFASSDSISRSQWKDFYDNSLISKNLPGVQGLGFLMSFTKQS